MSRAQHALMPHRVYSPTERRRFARFGPGRRKSRRVPLRRPEFRGFTRAYIEHAVEMIIHGAAYSLVERLGALSVVVDRPAADLRTLRAELESRCPAHIHLTVVSTLLEVSP